MSKRFFRTISLALAVFLMTASLGACKKNTESESSISNTKTPTSAARNTTSSKSNTTANNSSTATNSTNSNEQATLNSEEIAQNDSSTSATTSKEEMNAYLDITPSDNVDVAYIDQNADLGGITIKVMYDVNVSRAPGEPPTQLDLESDAKAAVRYNTMEAAKKKMNFNIDWIYRGHDNLVYEFTEASAAGVKYGDIILSDIKRVFPKLAVNKYIVPMDNFVDFNNDTLYNFGLLPTGTEFLGRKWGFVTNPYAANNLYVAYYNKDIFIKEGFTDLQELYVKGLWTWDTMLDYAKKATHDSNADGVIDQWGLIMGGYPNQAIIYSNGGNLMNYDKETNSYKLDTNNINTKHALQFLADITNARVAPTSASVKFDRFPSAMLVGKIYADWKTYWAMGINYGIVPLPKGPDVSEHQFVSENGVEAYFIPTTADPKVSAAVIKEAFTYWDTNRSEYLTKGDMLRTFASDILPDGSDVDSVATNFPAQKISLMKSLTKFNGAFSRIIGEVKIGRKTPDQAYSDNAATVQQALNESLLP